MRLELSLQLTIMASIIATLFAIPLGALAALKQDTWVDYAIRLSASAGLAMPGFWVGIVTIMLSAVLFPLFATADVHVVDAESSRQPGDAYLSGADGGYRYSAVATRMTRSTLLEVMRDDYVRTARAKGVSEQSWSCGTRCATRCCRS